MKKEAFSVTGLRDFWKFLGTNLLKKVAKLNGDLLGYSEIHNF